MADLIIALLLVFGYSETGYTSRYDPYIMDYQVEYHDLELHCDHCAVAVSDCSEIGKTWLIRKLDSDEYIPVVVADCAGKDALDENGVSWMDKRNIPVGLSYELAVLLGAVHGSVKIEVIRMDMEN